MDRIIKEQYAVSLIVKEMSGTLSEMESGELQAWLSEDRENRKIYEELRMTDVRKEIGRYQQLDSRKGWNRYKALHGRDRKYVLRWWSSIAAVVAIVFLVVIRGGLEIGRNTEELAVVKPGSSKAMLVLADGSHKELSHSEQEEVIDLGSLKVRNEGTLISYDKEELSEDELTFNELCVPIGGEYQLILSDGTHVWLNSETKLRYPVQFNGDRREVYLDGEAFFEVTKDQKRPFCVITCEQMSVEVLGTSFNVRAYQDEEVIEAVLVEGSVKVASAESTLMLVPGNKSSYDMGTGRMTLETVNTKLYTAWRNGQFFFVKKRLEDIFKDISRWYGIEVIYENDDVKDILFSGSLKKHEHIAPLLEAMETAGGVGFELKGRTLMVRAIQDL